MCQVIFIKFLTVLWMIQENFDRLVGLKRNLLGVVSQNQKKFLFSPLITQNWKFIFLKISHFNWIFKKIRPNIRNGLNYSEKPLKISARTETLISHTSVPNNPFADETNILIISTSKMWNDTHNQFFLLQFFTVRWLIFHSSDFLYVIPFRW